MDTGRDRELQGSALQEFEIFLLQTCPLVLLLSSGRAAFAAAGRFGGCWGSPWSIFQPLQHAARIWHKIRAVPFLQRQRNAQPGASRGGQHPCDSGGPGAAVPASPSRSSLLN